MKNSKKLMEERGALVEELETLLDTVATEERDFSDNENERQDAIHLANCRPRRRHPTREEQRSRVRRRRG